MAMFIGNFYEAWWAATNVASFILILFFAFTCILAFPKYSRFWALFYSLLILTQLYEIVNTTAYQIAPDGKSYASIFIEWSLQYNIGFSTDLDGLSLCFVYLTVFIFPICVISTWSLAKEIPLLMVCLLILEILLIICFTTSDLFFFYISF